LALGLYLKPTFLIDHYNIVNFKIRRNGMKIRIQHLLVAMLIALVAVPAYAATYDASGRWLIDTDPDQSITITLFETADDVAVSVESLGVTIVQDGDDTFDIETDPTDFSDLFGSPVSYSGKGTVSEDQYTFSPPLIQSINLGDRLEDPLFNNYTIDVSLAGFKLTTDNELTGEFAFAGAASGNVAFTGTRVVPLPAAVWLFGTGIVGLVGLKRRFKA
jgi:hypothetical protein